MIVALSGKLSSGKTLSASLLYNMFKETSYNPKLKSIATPVYQVVSTLTNKSISFIQDNKTQMSDYSMTYRELLQKIGIHYREELAEDIWLDLLFSDNYNPKNDIIIIDDLRFNNEVDYIKKKGECFLVRLERYSNPIESNLVEHIVKEYRTKKNVAQHSSETQLDNYNGWNTVITNKDDIETLIKKLEKNVCKPVIDLMKTMKE